MISVKGLTYTYPAAPAPSLQDIDLQVPAGQFLAIIGANGAGKSTLCYALSGFIPDFYKGTVAGEITVAGHDLVRTPLAQLAGEIGLVFANPFNQITGARFTVREELAFGLENLGTPARRCSRASRKPCSSQGWGSWPTARPMHFPADSSSDWPSPR